jgi:predicted phage terminase large subunit-like protein
MRGRFKVPPHLDLLNRTLVDVAARRKRRVIVTMPPRHGKSMLTSHFFPAWYVGTFPDHRVLMAGYQAQFAARWGRRARAVIDGVGQEVFGVSVSKKSSAADRWDIEGHLGGMETAGVGGALTGKGADLLLIDDPISNAADASSETMRENLWDWYTSTAYTRLEPKASLVLIQTRWHEDDLAGRLIEEMKTGGEQWEVLNLPAIAEENDLLGRPVGAALWPSRYDETELAVIKRTQGERNWSALYQQRPTPADGDVFKRSWFKRYRIDGDLLVLDGKSFPLKKCWRFATADLAVSEKTTADWTVIQSWAVTPDNDAVLLDQHRERMNGPQIVPAIKAVCEKWKCDWVGIESVAFQLAIVQQARLSGLTAKKLITKGDKISRAHAAAPRMEAGMVYFPDERWVDGLESELLSFPNGKHDDQVDALSYALIEIHRIAGGLEAE